MGAAVWLAPVAGLIGVMLGGLVSFALSYQQIREARSQRVDEASRELRRRSEDRRFTAYADFISSHRAVQNALRFYYSQAAIKLGVSDIDALLQSGYNSSATVFLVAETRRTHDACAEVLRVLQHTHNVIHENDDKPDKGSLGPELDVALGRAMREFQNAARAELNVSGPQWTWDEREQTRSGAEASSPGGGET